MAVHDSTAIMDRLAKMEANLVLHQNKVANRAKEDVDKLLSNTSLLIQKMDTSYSALVKHNTDFVEKMMGIKVQQELAREQLVKVEDRLINTKSVQIGLMEARMVVNTHEAMMQIGGCVNKLGLDMLGEFKVMKNRLMVMQSTMEVGCEVKEEINKETKKKRKKRANPKKVSVKKAKGTKEVAPKVSKGSKKSKSVKKKPNNPPSMSNSDEEVTYLGSANNSLGKESVNSSLEKENAVRSLVNENLESVPGFDSDFLDLMRDANIMPEEQGSEVPSKIVKIEDTGDDITDAALDKSGSTNEQSRSEIVETVTVKTESININDVKSEEVEDSIVKVELDDEDDLVDISNNNGIASPVDENHHVAPISPAKIMSIGRNIPVGIRCNVVPRNPKIMRILPPVCPQVSSKPSSMSSLKRRHSTSLGVPSRHLPVVPVVNRMLPPQPRRDPQHEPNISSSSVGVTQTQAVSNKTPADGKVINIVFSCGFCGEDSFSKHDLEEHIGANHRNHFLQ